MPVQTAENIFAAEGKTADARHQLKPDKHTFTSFCLARLNAS
jgi:hypothetical protein